MGRIRASPSVWGWELQGFLRCRLQVLARGRPVVAAKWRVDPTVGRSGHLHPVGGRDGDWVRVNAGQCGVASGGVLLEAGPIRRRHARTRKGADAFRRRPVLVDWQVKLAKTFLRSRLSEQVSIAEVASVCGLSTCYFIKAFTESVGVAPYSWLIAQRIERACLLIGRDQPLAQIALECGFTDQSHFTKAFAKQIGMTPARWRQQSMR